MFERFTDRARQVVVLAQEEARLLKHNYIGSEHIVLALVREGGGVAAKVVESAGISEQAVRESVVALVSAGTGSVQGHIPFTPQAKRVLELSLREALQLGCDYIGTEHVLLGILREGEGPGYQVLTELGMTLNEARQRVAELLEAHSTDPERAARRRRAPQSLVSASRIEMLSERLANVERWTGLAPDLAEIDEQISRVRRDKETAIEQQDFQAAAALREEEKALQAARLTRSNERTSGPTLADELRRLSDEVERLRVTLREHGIEPGGAA